VQRRPHTISRVKLRFSFENACSQETADHGDGNRVGHHGSDTP
jgi:hypothetical protein